MARRTPAAEPPTSARELVLDLLRRQIPDPEFTEEVTSMAASVLSSFQRVRDAPPEATLEDLLASLREAGEGLVSLGARLAAMPERVVEHTPPEMRTGVRDTATGLTHLGRSLESMCDGLGSLAAWAEGGDRE